MTPERSDADRLELIEARLAEVTGRNGREVWHAGGCAYDHGYPCDCMRDDVEWLAAELRAARHHRPRCESRRTEGSRAWRCDLPAGHPGHHRSTSGRRRWEATR